MKNIKTRLPLLILFFYVTSGSAQNWRWTTSYYKNDIYLNLLNNEKPAFDVSLGGGGCIDRVRYIPSNYLQLLAPPNNKETDRVIHWVFWSNTIKKKGVSGSDDPRYNTNQAGNNAGVFNPTFSVSVQQNLVDVYSVANLIWETALAPYMKSSVPSLTRYEMLPGGILKVKRILRASAVTLDKKIVPDLGVYIEAWTPFLKSSATFNAMALGLDNNGAPYNWYKAGKIPGYFNQPVGLTDGYGVVFQNGNISSKPVAAWVYGKKQASFFNISTGGNYVLNTKEWERGLAVLPGLYIDYLPEGSIVEEEFYLVLRPNSDQVFAATLKNLSAGISGPKVYGPAYPFTGEMARIVQKLNALYNWQGDKTNRTNLLQTLINGRRIGSIEDEIGINADSKMNVYPNPVSDVLNIKFDLETDQADLFISDLTGREIYNATLSGSREASIDCSSFENGVYILKIKSGNECRYKKFIKQ